MKITRHWECTRCYAVVRALFTDRKQTRVKCPECGKIMILIEAKG